MKTKFFRDVNDKATCPVGVEKAVNSFLAELEEKGSCVLSVEYKTDLVRGSYVSEYRVITTCMVTYEDKKQKKDYDSYWDEHSNNRMLRHQMFKKERVRLEAEGVENAEEVAWGIVRGCEWPPENE